MIRAWAAAWLTGGWLLAAGCRPPERDVDSTPIALGRGPAGELTVAVETPAGPGVAVLDTAAPVTFWHRLVTPAVASRRDVRLLGPSPVGTTPPIRAEFRDLLVVEAVLGPLGAAAPSLVPTALIGADLFSGFAVEIGFAAPEMTFWRLQSASDGFLAAGGHAVLRVPRRGGGRLEVDGPTDWLGRRAPVQVDATRLVLRTCAAPSAFRREDPLPERCCTGGLRQAGQGVDLGLVLATGVGPIVLGEAAWNRISFALPTPAVFESRPLYLPASPVPILARWTTIPRVALVDREVELSEDPGPCAELGRSRRLEQVAVRQAASAERAACALECDRDRGEAVYAENSAAYLELEGNLAVAVVDDVTPFLQSLRAEVRPEGPEVDGLMGAQALGGARAEIDYLGGDLRAIFSCEPTTTEYPPEATVPRCRAVGSCPRLPDQRQRHVCFGLPAHGLPNSCDNDPQRTCVD